MDDRESAVEQHGVFMDALNIHIARTPERGEQWLDEGRDKMIGVAKDKVNRIQYAIANDRDFNEDDALDAINYLAFAIRCNRRGRIESELDD